MKTLGNYVRGRLATDARMASLSDQWLEIFRVGNYGDKGNYTAEDLESMANSYDPARDEAPLVIGHPTLDAPAYGWVKKLKFKDGVLLAKAGEVDPDFEAAVAAGNYKKRSIALQRMNDGHLRLRHVGFLGAIAPEIKGLRDAHFSESEFQTFVVGEEHMATTKFATVGNAEMASSVSKNVRVLISALKGQKKWISAYDAFLPHLFSQLDRETRTFANGGAQKSGIELLFEFVSDLHDRVPIEQISRAAFNAGGRTAAMSIPVPGEFSFDPESIELDFAVRAVAQEKGISYVDASREVIAGRSAAFNACPGITVDPASIERANRAEMLCRQKGISYGEALREIGR